jgi:hypothetical protein
MMPPAKRIPLGLNNRDCHEALVFRPESAYI